MIYQVRTRKHVENQMIILRGYALIDPMISHKENEVLKVEGVEALCRSQKWAPRADTAGDSARIHWLSALLEEPQVCLGGSVPSYKHADWVSARTTMWYTSGQAGVNPGFWKTFALQITALPLVFHFCFLPASCLESKCDTCGEDEKNTRKKTIHT